MHLLLFGLQLSVPDVCAFLRTTTSLGTHFVVAVHLAHQGLQLSYVGCILDTFNNAKAIFAHLIGLPAFCLFYRGVVLLSLP